VNIQKNVVHSASCAVTTLALTVLFLATRDSNHAEACQLAARAASNAQKFSPQTRAFRFTYNFTVKDIPSGARRVRVWVPVPQTDQHQTVRVLDVKAPVKTRITHDPKYDNRIMYAEIKNSVPNKADFTLEYELRATSTRLAITLISSEWIRRLESSPHR